MDTFDEQFINSQFTKGEKMSDQFLSDSYEVPSSTSGYMKFESGDNQFRIMTSPIVGWEFWINKDGEPRMKGEKPQEGDKPVRFTMDNPPKDAGDAVKHFWAMVVYNYKTKSFQILQLTQKSIIVALTNLARSKSWGNPKGQDGYDIQVTKTGEKLDTEYTVLPIKPEKLSQDIMDEYAKTSIKLEALFDGGDPFAK